MKWISAKERLPDSIDEVLIYYYDQYINFGMYHPDVQKWTTDEYIEISPTHWMPLPEPPKEEKNPVNETFCQRKDGSYPLLPPCCNDYYPEETEVEYGGSVRFATSKLCDNEGEEILCKCGKQGDLIISKDAFLVICRECKNKLKG